MAHVRPTEPVQLFCGIIAAGAADEAEARRRLVARFGPVSAESGPFAFDFTGYYRDEMGEPLTRRFLAFGTLIDPGYLAAAKLATNAIEQELADTSGPAPRRRVNLDPGYLTPAKVVLATTKDFSHRTYLRDGIYAEVTMNFARHGLEFHPWTYPDFKSGRYDEFFLALRRAAIDRHNSRPPTV